VAHHLHKALGLQLQVDVGDDLGAAQHTLQTGGLQDAVQLGQQEEHRVHKAEGQAHDNRRTDG